MLEEYRKIDRFKVIFAEVDMLRHVNNLTYMRWAETSRSDYFFEIVQSDIAGTMGMILAKLEVVFERQMSYREQVAIGCRVARIGTKSLDFAHEVWSVDRDLRCARIAATMVAMDYVENKTIAVPALWRERMAAFEPHPIAV
jgi:acyl-CoA thioester hydrolase